MKAYEILLLANYKRFSLSEARLETLLIYLTEGNLFKYRITL